jgi:hypothetical protein
VVLAEGGVEIGDVAEGVAHAQGVEPPARKGEGLAPRLYEGKPRRAPRLFEHPAARIQADDPRPAGQGDGLPGHQPRARGHVQDLHARPHPEPLQGLPPVESA